ncbi:MAG: CCA tRNA nucleotidyltransferase [archaeon]
MKRILSMIQPSEKEEKELKKTFNEIKKKIKIPYTKVIMGGSSAKGTHLKDNHDIDIYVKFKENKYAGLNISEILKRKLKFKGLNLLHGSRDYFQFKYNNFDIEVIPIIDIKKADDAHNITDISPLHITWVRKHKKKTNQIRLTKAFAKANEIYGAESFIKGFSGYSLEILTIHYGSFEKLLKAATKWKPKVIIDTENHYKKKNILLELNKSKIDSPIILIDPVQETRNVTSVVSQEKFLLFKEMAKKYLKSKNKINFFQKDKFNLEKLEKKHAKLFLLEIKPLDGKRDVVGAKLLKCHQYLEKQLRLNNFEIVESGWNWEGDALFWFAVKELKLSPTIKHYGPSKKHKERLDNFKNKWGKVKYEKDISYVMKQRDYTHAEDLLMALTSDEYVNSKVSSLNIRKVYK